MATFHENLVQSFHNFRDKYLKANGNFFKFSYDTTTKKYGFTINGTFHPFKTVQASKTVAAGTSAKTVTPDSGYDGIASVTVNPTPSQTKSATAGTSAVTVTPDSGKLLSKVTVNPTPSQTKSASPSTSAQTITPDSGKLLSSVIVNAMPLPAVATKWIDGTLNIIEGNLGARNTCTDGVVRSVFEIPQGYYYGGRSARDLIGVTDDKMRQLGWVLSGEVTGLVPISIAASHSVNSTANSISLRYYDVASKSFKTASTTVYGSTSQFGKGSWGFTLGGIGCAVTISEISVGDGSMVRLSVSTSATSVAPALSGYADYNVPNSSYYYAMTALLA